MDTSPTSSSPHSTDEPEETLALADPEESEDTKAKDEVAGSTSDEDGSWGDYPIDTLLIRQESRTVFDVLRRIEKGAFVMDPDFQRDFIWPEDKQSKLIESVLMRIPLPVFYLAEDEEGRMVVVDGLQRLSTFRRFVNGKLRLRLKERAELDQKKFEDLSPKLQNRIEDCNLVLYIIDAKVPDGARLDIFERVNSGEPLTRQQMRNSLFMGPATRFLKKEARTDLFMKATGGSLNSKTMRDREFVNRFCAFTVLPLEKYGGSMDDFLAEALRRMNRMSEPELSDLSSRFRTGLTNNSRVFGRYAFRKHFSRWGRRSVLNASLWDVMSTGLSRYPEHIVEAKAQELEAGFYKLMHNDEFMRAITYSVNHMGQVRARFKMANEMFTEVFGDH